jgi:hypothetical protein
MVNRNVEEIQVATKKLWINAIFAAQFRNPSRAEETPDEYQLTLSLVGSWSCELSGIFTSEDASPT